MICVLWFPEHDGWPTVNVAGTNLDNIKTLGCFFLSFRCPPQPRLVHWLIEMLFAEFVRV